MKFNLLILCVFGFIHLSAQNKIKVVKLDNSGFPKIEMIVKAVKEIDTGRIVIFENNKKINFNISDVPTADIKRDNQILFLINNGDYEKIRLVLLKEFKKLKKTDFINIGRLFENQGNQIVIQYVSPEFSQNRSFFKNYLEEKNAVFSQYTTCADQKKIQKELFSKNSEIRNTGIIIIGNFEKSKLNFCSDFKKNAGAPIYFIQTQKLKKEKEDKIINLCMKTGGMYTQSASDKDVQKILRRYKEDIALETKTGKTNLKNIKFHLSDNHTEAHLKISYNKENQFFIIKKPKKIKYTTNEIFLTIFSSLLLLTVLLLLIRIKNNGKLIKAVNAEKITVEPVIIVKPLEINIKGKGINKTYFFEKHLIRIGRNPDNDIVISDTTISGNHAIINKEGPDFMIQDLGSTNGVIVNKKKVKKQSLKTKDQIKLGGVVMFVRF